MSCAQTMLYSALILYFFSKAMNDIVKNEKIPNVQEYKYLHSNRNDRIAFHNGRAIIDLNKQDPSTNSINSSVVKFKYSLNKTHVYSRIQHTHSLEKKSERTLELCRRRIRNIVPEFEERSTHRGANKQISQLRGHQRHTVL